MVLGMVSWLEITNSLPRELKDSMEMPRCFQSNLNILDVQIRLEHLKRFDLEAVLCNPQ